MILFLASLSILFAPQSSHELVGGNYRFSPLSKYDNGYPKEKYEKVIKVLHEIYDPLIAAQGGEFKTLTDWTDGAVNMWAFRWGDEYWLEIPGGMSRYYLIEEEAFVISLCHELGHLLGGIPKNGDISFEGQADYYATHKCAEKVLEKITPIKSLKSDDEINEICNSFPEKDESLCFRTLAGSKSLTSYYAELEGSLFPEFKTPSTVKASQTMSSHPPSQCRLDTLIAGFGGGSRPNCWFKQ